MALVFIIFSVIITKINLSSGREKISQRLNELTTIAEASLPDALWQYNYNHLGEFVETLFQYEDIVLIKVVADEKTIIERVKEYARQSSKNLLNSNEDFASISEELTYEGKKVGVISFVIDRKVATHFITQNIIQAIAGLLVIITTASFAAYFFIRSTIIRPLLSLEQSTVSIAQGNLDAIISIKSDDEVGHLAKNLDEMRKAIKDFIEKLKRTDEIEMANRLLQKEIQEKEATQRSLRQSEDRFRYVLNHSVDTIYNINLNTRTFDYISPSCLKICGYTRDEFQKMGMDGTLDHLHPTDIPRIKEHYKKLLSLSSEQDFSSAIEYRFKHKKLGYRWIQDTRSIVCSHDNTPLSIVGSARDVTEKKLIELDKERLEEQLIHTQKMEAIGTMAGGIAHDFNNILSAILGYADMAQDDCAKDSSIHEDLEQILIAGNRAKSLVQQILSFSKREINEHSTIKLEPVFKETYKLLRATTPSNIKIHSNISPDCGYIMADSTKIHQVLMNLCVNASQSIAKKGGTIKMQLSQESLSKKDLADSPDFKPGSYVKISVSDNGPGIPTNILNRIFDPYFTTKRTGKGSGMGLAVVMGIIKSSNGFIRVHSQPDVETVFQVFFPEAPKIQKNTINQNFIPEKGAGHILVIDDEISLAILTKRRVESFGYKATMTTNSQEAIRIFSDQSEKIDLVITDQTMPDITGDQLFSKLRKIRKDIPFILCSGYNERMNSREAQRLGINSFLLKPVAKGELARAIHRIMTMQV